MIKRINTSIVMIAILSLMGCSQTNDRNSITGTTIETESIIESESDMQLIVGPSKGESDSTFYFSMQPINEDIYALLKAEYDNVGFSPRFEKGSENTFDIYTEKYKKFMNNEITYWTENGTEGYLKDIVPENDMENSNFYIFDVDGDSKQELYVRTLLNRIYVFKYREDDGKIHVWYQEKDTPYYYFVGTLDKAWSNGGDIYQFYILDENANEKITITFEQFHDLNPATQKDETVYIVRLPKYSGEESEIKMTEELKKYAYYIDGEYCFCVTKEQFEELTSCFFEANEKLPHALVESKISIEEPCSSLVQDIETSEYTISKILHTESDELNIINDERIYIEIPRISYHKNNDTIQQIINKELELSSLHDDIEWLTSQDIGDFDSYTTKYNITNTSNDILSICYFNDFFYWRAAPNSAYGITINTQTGEKIPVENYLTIDKHILDEVKNGKAHFESDAGYDNEFMMSYLESFVDSYLKGYEDSYSCFFVQDNTINLIIPVTYSNSHYFFLKFDIDSITETNLFDELISGNIVLEDLSVQSDYSKSSYEFVDLDNDSEDEMFIKTDRSCFVIENCNEQLQVVYEGSAYDSLINTSSLKGICYYRSGGAPTHETYQFSTFKENSKLIETIVFERYDENEDGNYDENDIYYYDGQAVSMNQWNDNTKEIRSNL